MKTMVLSFIFAGMAAAATAQQVTAQSPYPPDQRAKIEAANGFRIGGRYANYATAADIGLFTVDSGRQYSVGVLGSYRSGLFVLDFNWDHDAETGIDIGEFLPAESGAYSRDRGEITVGWSAWEYFDVQGGFRFDRFSITGVSLGNEVLDPGDVENNMILGGIHVHTPAYYPWGAYGVLRGYFGSATFTSGGTNDEVDSSGWRMEGGQEIPLGNSNFRVIPGLEFEEVDVLPRFNTFTNRFFVTVQYKFR